MPSTEKRWRETAMNAEVRPIKTAAETALAQSFAAVKRALPGAGAVCALREDAFRRFETEGLPHRRVEEWKYTDLRALMRDAKPLAAVPDAAAKGRAKDALAMLPAIEARRVVFVGGALMPELSDLSSLEAGLTIHPMAQALAAAGGGAVHVSTLMAAIGPQARFNEFLFTTGAAVVRNQAFVRFDGEGTIAGIRGASLLKGRQHADTTLVADHATADCTSREVFKSVLDEEGRSVFQGKIIVRRHATKTDAKMATHALLLSETAEADNKPELEIFADDVQCGHGATSGALDEDLLFYLKARGIPAKEAEALLIQAFVGEAVGGIERAALRDALIDQVGDSVAPRVEP